MSPLRRYFTTFEASHFLGVSLPTVVNWIKAGRLKAHRTPGGHRRIAREELASFIRRHGMPMPPELVAEGSAARILVVDGEKARGEQLLGLLKKAGYECAGATSGFAAGLAVGASKPDLLLLDLSMPGVEGGAAVTELHSHEAFANLPVIAIAGAKEERASRRASSAGCDDFVQRPFEPDAIKRKVEAALRARRVG